jgi:hypothetical protein
MRAFLFCALFGLCCLALASAGAQPVSPSQLTISTTTLPPARLRQPYQFQLQAQGGIPPFKWTVTRGSLPPGLTITEDGVISGTPNEKGEFPFVISLSDGSTPSQKKNQAYVFHVVAPLLAEWSQPPRVDGRRIEGEVKITNQTGHDFDLTWIVMAINEIGRATALGYQHGVVKDGAELQIPFAEQLPRGAYDVDATVVAEIVETDSIYRVHLVAGQKLQVTVGP